MKNNHSQQGLDKEVGSNRILSGNKKSVYADNPTDMCQESPRASSGEPNGVFNRKIHPDTSLKGVQEDE